MFLGLALLESAAPMSHAADDQTEAGNVERVAAAL